MAQAFRNRFKGRENEIKEDVGLQGLLPPMDKYQVKDLIAWKGYVTDLFNGQDPPLSTPYSAASVEELYGHLGVAVFRILVQQQAEIKRLRAERQSQVEMQELEKKQIKSGVLEAMKLLEGFKA